MINQYEVKNFLEGLITAIEAESISDGAASAGTYNWRYEGDQIALRRGQFRLGSDFGAGRVSGLHVGRNVDGTEVLIRSRERKFEYFDEDTQDWIESGSDALPEAASGEDIAITSYTSLAGYSAYASSPNSSIYQFMLANPGDIIDLASTTYRGYITAKQGSMYLWRRKDTNGGQDNTAFYRSYVDKDELSDYTQVVAEAIGSSGSANYTGTLAFKSGQPKRHCMGATFTDGTEIFQDNYNGTLTGSLGGSGTLNYATGAYDITFATVAAGPVTATYYWENPTSAGIADFTKSAPRTAGQGFVIRQDDEGGDFQTILVFDSNYYCIHEFKTWVFSISADDLSPSNEPFREGMGIENWRGAIETGEGIYYIDSRNQNDPKLRVATLDLTSSKVIPINRSEKLDLSGYRFDMAAGIEWGDFIVFAFRTASSNVNDTVLLYDRVLKTYDLHDYMVSCFAIYNGTLLGGGSATNNVFELFSGFDDDGATIANKWRGNISNLARKSLKKVKRIELGGLIQTDQEYIVRISSDRGAPVEVGRVFGNASYVNSGVNVGIGATTIGKKEIGGGSPNGLEFGHPYRTEIEINTDRFEDALLEFEAVGMGYVSISLYNWKDIRAKGKKLPLKYRS